MFYGISPKEQSDTKIFFCAMTLCSMKAVVCASGYDGNEFDAVVKYVIFLSVAA